MMRLLAALAVLVACVGVFMALDAIREFDDGMFNE